MVIIDYGMGNIGSLENMIRKAGGTSVVSSDKDIIANAKKLILPGVGSFDNGIKRLQELRMIDLLNKKVLVDKIPILCICLGIQLITKRSEEGNLPGLGWIDAETVRFHFANDQTLKIPHMGWNDIVPKRASFLFNDLPEEPSFYFVHSYHLVCNDMNDVLSTTQYGYEFVSSIEKGNIYATQFHPEKSHKYGLSIMSNFIKV